MYRRRRCVRGGKVLLLAPVSELELLGTSAMAVPRSRTSHQRVPYLPCLTLCLATTSHQWPHTPRGHNDQRPDSTQQSMLPRLRLTIKHLSNHPASRYPTTSRAAMSSFTLHDTDPEVSIHLPPDLNQTQLLSHPPFKTWLTTLQHSLGTQRTTSHTFHDNPLRPPQPHHPNGRLIRPR